jgi:hypothetical protein
VHRFSRCRIKTAEGDIIHRAARGGGNPAGDYLAERLIRTSTFLWLVLLSVAACAPRAGVTVAPDPAVEAKLAEADALLAKACYRPLKRAWRTYAELYAQPALRKRVAVPFLKRPSFSRPGSGTWAS